MESDSSHQNQGSAQSTVNAISVCCSSLDYADGSLPSSQALCKPPHNLEASVLTCGLKRVIQTCVGETDIRMQQITCGDEPAGVEKQRFQRCRQQIHFVWGGRRRAATQASTGKKAGGGATGAVPPLPTRDSTRGWSKCTGKTTGMSHTLRQVAEGGRQGGLPVWLASGWVLQRRVWYSRERHGSGETCSREGRCRGAG